MLTAFLFLLAEEAVEVEGQLLLANAERVAQALEILGTPLIADLKAAGHDARKIQQALDPIVDLEVTVGGGVRRGKGPAVLQQACYAPLLLKVLNPKGSKGELRVTSPQAGPVYAGVAELS